MKERERERERERGGGCSTYRNFLHHRVEGSHTIRRIDVYRVSICRSRDTGKDTLRLR